MDASMYHVETNGRLKGRISGSSSSFCRANAFSAPLHRCYSLFRMASADLVPIPDLSEAADGAILTLDLS